MNVDDDTLDHVSKLLAELEEDLQMAPEALVETTTPAQAAPVWKTRQKQVSAEKPGKDQRTRNPSSNVVTDVVLDLYKGDLLFSQPHGQFFQYEKEARGLWSPLTKIEILGDIRSKLQQLGDFLPNGFSTNLMNDVCTQLQSVLAMEDWYDGTELLLFTNGVLNVETRELLPFNREMHLVQQMPYPYDPAATCEEIIKWLKNTQHDSWERTQVLRAWLRATLLGRYEIQKFVEIVGPGKSGKSTYANLAVALVGKSNTYSTDFENMEKNRFEAAAYMGKKLLLFQDADRWGGSVSRLKAITGNDWIRRSFLPM
jgi:putative DNA primase/helicase